MYTYNFHVRTLKQNINTKYHAFKIKNFYHQQIPFCFLSLQKHIFLKKHPGFFISLIFAVR